MRGEAKGIQTHARITASEHRARPERDAYPHGVEVAIGRRAARVSVAVDRFGPEGIRRVASFVARAMLVIAVTVLTAACAARAGDGNPPGIPGLEDQIEIRVINNNFSDARLYAVHPGGREYIGVLTGKTEANYRLDWDWSHTLAIEISLLAGGTCTTEELIVDPGEALFLSIDSTMSTMANCRQSWTGLGGP